MRPRILFLGSKALGLRVLGAVRETGAGEVVGVVTLDDSGDRRSALDRFRAEVPGLHVMKGAADTAAIVHDLHPDLVVVSGWYSLIDQALLAAVPRGFVGLHGSSLPAYRGHAPIVWQMIHGCPTVGLSLFRFGRGIDDGPIWVQAQISVGPEDYIADVLAKVEDTAADMVRRNLRSFLESNIDWSQPQDPKGASYCGQRIPSDGKIDWRWPAPQIYDFIRAQSDPYPGAYTALGAERLIIWRAKPADGLYFGTPGQVVAAGQGGAIVACGENTALKLEKTERADWSFRWPPAPCPRLAPEPLTPRTRLG